MAKDDKDEAAIFRVMWELAKIDGQPIQIGNTVFDPLKIDEGRGFDLDRLKPAMSYLQEQTAFEDATECLQAGNENQARESLKFYHPWFRLMRDAMWKELFRFLVPMGDPERIQIILRQYTADFRSLKTNDELRALTFAALDNEKIAVPKNRKTRKPWAKSFSELKKGTAPYNNVMTTLRRYFAGYKPRRRKSSQTDPR
jgi:hypothetical protein